jgi:hypothetical protein
MKKNNRIFQLLKNNVTSQNGMALLATLIFVFILTTFGIALLTMTRNDIKLSVLQEESTKAFYLADAGVERGINWLEKQPTPPSPEDLPPANLDGIHVFEELDTGQYRVNLYIDTDEEITVAGYTIDSEGWVHRADGSELKKNIKTLVSITNFAQYAYFSDKESFPTNPNIPGSYGGYAGQTIWFTGNDTFGGRLHSNGQLHIVDVPNFMGKVTSSVDEEGNIQFIDFWGGAYAPDGHDFPTGEQGFMDGYELGVDIIDLPQYRNISDLDDENSLQRIAGGSKTYIQDNLNVNGVYVPNAGGPGTEVTAGIYVTGNVSNIELDVDSTEGLAGPNSQTTITQSGSTTVITSVKEPVTLPLGSLRNGEPAGGTTIPANTTLVREVGTNNYISYNGLTNGLLFVDGSINSLKGDNHRGKMSIASTQSITITDDIYYYDRDEENTDLFEDDIESIEDSLGLIAAKDVEIASGVGDLDGNIEIDAIIMALSTSFFYEGWQYYKKGTLSLLGGLIQKERGPVGTHNAGVKVTGFSKNYIYDTRMANPAGGKLPPYFPSTGQYEKVWWKEVY